MKTINDFNAPWWVMIGDNFISGNQTEDEAKEVAAYTNGRYGAEVCSVITKPETHAAIPRKEETNNEAAAKKLQSVFKELTKESKDELIAKFQNSVDFIDSDADKKQEVENLFDSLDEKYKIEVLNTLKGGK